MFERILVPVDGSKLADRILPYVTHLALPSGSEVMLVRVLDDFAVDDALLRGDDIFGKTEARLDEGIETLCSSGVAARFEIRRGDDAAGRILECAEDYRPSVIALSTHGSSGADRWLRGSVAERLLRRSRFPVFLLNSRVEAPNTRFARILVPLDGSELSESVLREAHAFARLFDSEIVLLHVLEEKPATYPVAWLSESRGEARATLERAARQLQGVKVRTVIAEGSPAYAILHAIETEKADLVAMTTHGRSRLSRWAFGSVAEHVLHHCHTPLLVVRTGGIGAGGETSVTTNASSVAS